MTQRNNVAQPIDLASFAKPILIGASIGLFLILLFLLPAGDPNPEWEKYWMIKPIIMVPFAGAVGGAFYHLMSPMRRKGGWNKIVANIISFIVFIFGLWIGSVLGLNGTYWN